MKHSAQDDIQITQMHWQFGLLQQLDIGLVVIDRDYNIQLWNMFMEHHSGRQDTDVHGRNLFTCFPDLPANWLKHKIESIFELRHRSFITWEQRPYLFRFKSSRPLTGASEFMYQNITLIPLNSLNGEVGHVGILVHDVTDAATSAGALREANGQLEHLSRTDRLTQLLNRGYWEEQVAQEFQRFSRSHSPSTLVMLDIDHFKKINDTYGHQAGDEVIRRLASLLNEQKRSSDLAGRYGGEEFGLLLPETSAHSALTLVERLRKHIRDLVIEFGAHEISFTISLGIAELSESVKSYDGWISQADQALYHSKESGRDRATVFLE